MALSLPTAMQSSITGFVFAIASINSIMPLAQNFPPQQALDPSDLEEGR